MKTKDNRKLFVDTLTLSKCHILTESQAKQYTNESSFQSIYSNIKPSKLSPKILCVIEGRFGKDRAISVNGRFYGKDFWEKQLAKEQTQFLLRKGLMYMQFGHVDKGIEDKDVEEGVVAGIVTHLEVIKQPTEINGQHYNAGDLFGRAIIIETGGKNAGLSVYSLLSVGSEISISSRGLGEYIVGETYQTEDGNQLPIMNPDTYELETFDFTRLPGISDAEVHLTVNCQEPNANYEENEDNDEIEFEFESIQGSDKTLSAIQESAQSLIFNIKKENINMKTKMDGKSIQQVLEDANAKIAQLRAKNEDLEQKVDDLEAERDNEKERADKLQAELDEKSEDVEAGTQPDDNPTIDTTVDNNVKKVDTSELAEVTADNLEDLKKYKDIAETPDELNEVLVKVAETLQKCEDDAAEVERLKAERDNLKADLDEKDKDIQECSKALESYVKLGSIAELTAMVESNKSLIKESRKQKLIAFTEHYSNKKGITQETVKRIIESSKSIKAAKVVLESLPNKDINKGLYRDTKTRSTTKEQSGFSTFAESFIDKAEKRRLHKSYTV